MIESKPNDNGLYFEYLVTKKIQDDHKLSLTKRAEIDQERDSKKNIDPNIIKKMELASEKISCWVKDQIKLNEKSILDRSPDIEGKKTTHEDISIVNNNNQTLSFSLKHNHDAIFHGRIGSIVSNNWLNMDKDNGIYKKFESNKVKLINDLHEHIPIGTEFAGAKLNNSDRKGVKEIYQLIWKEFIYSLHEEVKKVLSNKQIKKPNVKYLFLKIIGTGSDQYRILKKENKVIIQDLRNIKIPTKFTLENVQILNNDPRSLYVWHLVLKFNNGLVINGRTKQDSKTMSKSPKIKTDWRIIDWGNSGLIEEILS